MECKSLDSKSPHCEGTARGNKSKTSCCVPLCTKTGYLLEKGEKVTFHKFPKSVTKKKEWLVKIRRDEDAKFTVTNATRICSRHFVQSDFHITLKGRKFVKECAVPSLFPWTKSTKPRHVTLFPAGSHSAEMVESDVQEGMASSSASSSLMKSDKPTCNSETEILQQKIDKLEKELAVQKEAAEFFQKERDLLRNILQANRAEKRHQMFSIERFKHNDKDVCFYTGFPNYSAMEMCFHLLNPGKDGHNIIAADSVTTRKVPQRQKLSVMDQFFMTLIRLRLGLFEQSLSHLFNISVSTVNRITTTWSNFMYLRLGSINIWPTKDMIVKTMPASMKAKYPNLEWIIDACEIQCERPSSLILQSQSYSSYKSRNTLKCLVACTPSGQIGFVSALYLGNISDRELTIRSGFLKMPHNRGAMWLVDKGFQIQDLADPLGVTVNMPAFVGSKGQLEAKELFHTQLVASERIHIEPAINKIKNFHIFDRPVPLSTLGMVNQQWAVCAFLTLFQGPIISA